jgi:hypothetical protein
VTTTTMLRGLPEATGRTVTRALGVTAFGCAAIFVIGLFAAPERVWAGYLIGFNALVGLALAGPLFLALLNISGARWARPMNPVLEAMGSALPAAAGVGLLLLFGVSSLFEWSHAATVAGDHVLLEKAAYLNSTAFTVRLVVFFALWLLMSRWLVRASRVRDGEDRNVTRRRRMRAGALFLLVFTPTWSLAGIDWLMSLQPHWFSAIWALRTVSGVALAGLGAGAIYVVALRRADPRAGVVGKDQLGDIGVLIFSLALFWGYIWYSQYMLVWYTNMPEETTWYVARSQGTWGLLSRVNLALNFGIPFVLMLFGRLRRSEKALLRVGAILLVGRLVDLYMIAGPPLMGDAPAAGVWELAPVLGQIALFFLITVRALSATREGRPAPRVLPPSEMAQAALPAG